MAINLRCQCGGETKLSAKVCPRCGVSFLKKGKKYKVTVRANGKKATKTVSNLELAREIESKLKVEIVRGEYQIERKKVPTLGIIWGKYLPWAQEHKKSWRSDKYNFEKHLNPIFGNRNLDQISPFDIEKLMISMKKGKNQHGKEYTAATIKHIVVLLSRLYVLADQWGLYHGKNPCEQVKKPTLNNQITEYLSNAEVSRLLETLEGYKCKQSAKFVEVLLYTGLRRGELFKLTWADIDFNRKLVTLKDPKGKFDQILPLSDKALESFRSLPANDSKFVFPGKNGGLRVEFKRPWADIKAEAGLPKDFRMHGLRHHFASSLVNAGVDIYTVSKLLTHKDIKTTQRYAHLADKSLRDAVELSDKLQNKNKGNILNISEGIK